MIATDLFLIALADQVIAASGQAWLTSARTDLLDYLSTFFQSFLTPEQARHALESFQTGAPVRFLVQGGDPPRPGSLDNALNWLLDDLDDAAFPAYLDERERERVAAVFRACFTSFLTDDQAQEALECFLATPGTPEARPVAFTVKERISCPAAKY